MKLDEPKIDWRYLPAGLEPSWALYALHDGALQRIETDARARTAALWFTVKHFPAPEGVIFGLELTGVSALRASVKRPFPDAFDRQGPPGETRDQKSDRITAWHALGQEVSISWDEFERVAREGGLSFWFGGFARSEEGAAIHFVGSYPLRPISGIERRPVRIVIAASALVWSRSDGLPWSAEEMEKLYQSPERHPARRRT